MIDFCTAEKNISEFGEEERKRAQDQFLNRNPINLVFPLVIEKALHIPIKLFLKF